MSDMKEALLKAKLVSAQDVARARTEERRAAAVATDRLRVTVDDRDASLSILLTTRLMSEFRRETRALLLKSLLPKQHVEEIIDIVYRRGIHLKRNEGGPRLLAELHLLRNKLSEYGLRDDQRRNFIETFPLQ